MKKINLIALAIVISILASACGHTTHRIIPGEAEYSQGVYFGGDHTGMLRHTEIDISKQHFFRLPGAWWQANICPFQEDGMGLWKCHGVLNPMRDEKPGGGLVKATGEHETMTVFHWREDNNILDGLKPGRNDVELISICPHIEGAGKEAFRAINKLCVGYRVRVTIIVPEEGVEAALSRDPFEGQYKG